MKAIILLSGGIDSCVALSMALERGLVCLALSFDYGQRHLIELQAATALAKHYGIIHKTIKIDPTTFSLSSLVTNLDVPKDRTPSEIASGGIPNTYVPARNSLFLAYALGQAEIHEAQEIHVGFNAMDRIPYPDCRPEYLSAFQGVFDLATRQAIEHQAPKIVAPLIDLDKHAIVKEAKRLKAPLELTFSCYDPIKGSQPCGHCDACTLRAHALITENGTI